MSDNTSTKHSLSILKINLINYGLSYVSYNFLLAVFMLSFVLLLITIINFTGGNLRLLGYDRLIHFLKFNIPERITFNEKDIIKIYSLLSFIFMILGTLFAKILNVVFNIKVAFDTRFRIISGITFLTLLMLLAQISVYFPNAAKGAKTLWGIILFFWISAIFSYIIYSLFILLQERLEKNLSK